MAKNEVVTTGRLIGYARVSTKHQDEGFQLDALREAGVQARDIFTDHGVSGAKTSRPAFDRMLEHVEPGDTIVVWKLDRLGRNTGHVITMLDDLVSRDIHIRALTDGVDTTTIMGRAMMKILAVFAEMERGFNQERTSAAMAARSEQGAIGGRPRALETPQVRIAQRSYDEGMPVSEIAAMFKVSVPTVYRYLGRPTTSEPTSKSDVWLP